MNKSHSTCSIHLSDAVKWARQYEGLPFHALFTDAPYHLTNDARGIIRYAKKEYIKTRKSGFMGQSWDGGDVAFRPETWDAFKQVLHDGAFGMSYAGSRGWHRVATAIEDAGFIIHPTIFLWAYGSGFPKATRIDTQIDKSAGAERIVIGKAKGVGKQNPEWNGTAKGRIKNSLAPEYDATLPATDLAKVWQGHRYGLQALKPSCEPIIVFQKPYKGRPVDNITRTGAGAWNIEGSRIGTETIVTKNKELASAKHEGWKRPWHEQAQMQEFVASGRWASNLILLDEAAAEKLDEQSGESATPKMKKKYRTDGGSVYAYSQHATGKAIEYEEGFSDSGGASRFFYIVREQIESADPLFYTSKANGAERDAALGDIERAAGAQKYGSIRTNRANGYDEESRALNSHPTVKPLDLNRYLATLLLPPDAYSPRRLFVPFAGVGSEMIGAAQAGWDEIEGVELMNEYVILARKRILFYKHHSPEYKPRKKKEISRAQRQLL